MASDTGHFMSRLQVAQVLGCSKELVRNIEVRALRKLWWWCWSRDLYLRDLVTEDFAADDIPVRPPEHDTFTACYKPRSAAAGASLRASSKKGR